MRSDLGQFENVLRQQLSVRSVTALKGFPCASHRDFIERVKNGSLQVLTGYHSSIVPCLGSLQPDGRGAGRKPVERHANDEGQPAGDPEQILERHIGSLSGNARAAAERPGYSLS